MPIRSRRSSQSFRRASRLSAEQGGVVSRRQLYALGVTRWGNTSFDVGCAGAVGDRSVFVATLTYVGVKWGTKETMPAPPAVRALLGDAPAPA